MKRIKRISALVLCFVICLGILNINPAVASAKELTYSSFEKSNSLSTVYVSGKGTQSATGENESNPTSDFIKAITTVREGGEIVVVDDISVGNINFLDKYFFLKGKNSNDYTRKKITFSGEVNFKNIIYVNDLDFEFTSKNKDCVFLNGAYIKMENSAILGNPNIYLGSKDNDLEYGDNGSLEIINNSVIKSQISNIYLGGFGNHTVKSSSIELKNVELNGKINGKNVTERSNVGFLGEVTVPSIENVYKVIVYDNANLKIVDSISNVTEMYADKTAITLSEKSKIEADYLYGDIQILFDNNRAFVGNLITCKNIVGEISISKDLMDKGYTINKIRSGNDIIFALFNSNDEQKTNYAPSIKHQQNIVMREGTSVDLHKGVSAWDYEDGNITDSIIYPNVDLTSLSVGKHEIVYEVTDRQGNVTKSVQYVYVIENDFPIFKGVKDIEIKAGEVESFDLLSGITVKDNKDKDLTIKTEGEISKPAPDTKESFVITYTVEDSENHVSTAKRTITVTNYMPKIKGLDDVVINKGETFDFLNGVTASDYEDGTISNIILENKIDINKPGTYNLVYTVTDSDLNTTKAVRKVTVKGSSDWVEIEPSNPIKPDVNPTPKPDAEDNNNSQKPNENEKPNSNSQSNDVDVKKPSSKPNSSNKDAKPVYKPVNEATSDLGKEDVNTATDVNESAKEEQNNTNTETNAENENNESKPQEEKSENKNYLIPLLCGLAVVLGVVVVLIIVLKKRNSK